MPRACFTSALCSGKVADRFRDLVVWFAERKTDSAGRDRTRDDHVAARSHDYDSLPRGDGLCASFSAVLGTATCWLNLTRGERPAAINLVTEPERLPTHVAMLALSTASRTAKAIGTPSHSTLFAMGTALVADVRVGRGIGSEHRGVPPWNRERVIRPVSALYRQRRGFASSRNVPRTQDSNWGTRTSIVVPNTRRLTETGGPSALCVQRSTLCDSIHRSLLDGFEIEFSTP